MHLACRTTWHHKQRGPCHALGHGAQVKEVGDGNINYVYVLEGPAGSLCLKQGHPYVRIMKSWKLSQVSHLGEQELLICVLH